MKINDTIVALATASGAGAIAIIRVSGKDAIEIVNPLFSAKSGKQLKDVNSHTIHLGDVKDNAKIIDEALVSVFKGTKSYTGEPTVEISCHGSHYIQQEIIQLLLRKGCRAANPGEFTLRAFINGKMDLSQAEAVADIIAAESESAHKLAVQQLRGGFSKKMEELRQELIEFKALIELELDFSQEEVEFANIEKLKSLLNRLYKDISDLKSSFDYGNVLKKGVHMRKKYAHTLK